MDISESYSKYTCWIFPIIGLYPILKLNYSTPLLILLFLHIVLKQRPQITTSSVRSVALLTAFLAYFLITLSYSNNFTQGINEWIRLMPLLLIPPFIFFWNFSISPSEKTNFIKVFVFSNIVFCFLLLYILGFFDSIKGSLAEEISARFLSDYAQKIIHSKDNPLFGWLFVNKAYFSMNTIMALFLVFQLHIQTPIKLLISSLFVFVILYSFSVPNVFVLVLISIFVGTKLWSIGTILQKASLFLVAVGLILTIVYKLNTRDVNKAVVFANEFFEADQSEGNDPRKAIYHSALEIYREYPMGVGIGATQTKLDEKYKNRIDGDANQLLFTEELNDDYWFKNNVIVEKNTLISPDDIENAEIIATVPGGSPKGFSLSKSIQVNSSEQYTLSAYLKPIGKVVGILRFGDLSSGRVNINFAQNNISFKGSEITDVLLTEEPDGWYRVAITTALDSGNHNLLLGITNTTEGYNMTATKALKMGAWGIQLNKGEEVLPYSRSTKDLYDYAYRNRLNTHNYFLHVLMIGGPVALFLFLVYLGKMATDFYKTNNTISLVFFGLLVINMLSENILFRHAGIFFVTVFMLFSYAHRPYSQTQH